MTAGDDIADRIKTIREVFLLGQKKAEACKNFSALATMLDECGLEFRSVAYEGASMALALGCIDNGDDLTPWYEFKNGIAFKHSSQVHAGLGWALAQRRISPSEILLSVSPLMKFRILDGWGYYDGIFRQRAAILSRILPEEITGMDQYGYDQGIGRAIYYQCKGEGRKIHELISSFPEARRGDLWRGTGIACVYVGGCDEKKLQELYTLSATYSSQLAVGAALVACARSDADAMTAYVEPACNAWCNASAADVIQLTLKTDALIMKDAGEGKEWIAAMAELFAPINSRS